MSDEDGAPGLTREGDRGLIRERATNRRLTCGAGHPLRRKERIRPFRTSADWPGALSYLLEVDDTSSRHDRSRKLNPGAARLSERCQHQFRPPKPT